MQSAQLITRFAMVKPDGTAMHMHTIYGFQPTQFTTKQNNTVYVLKGTAIITMREGPVENVLLMIKVFNNAVIGLWIGPDKGDEHSGLNPTYETLSMGSRSMMVDKQNLTKTNVPITIPLTRGYENGHEIFYISTEASDKDLASLMTN